jgi:hypothetical protein
MDDDTNTPDPDHDLDTFYPPWQLGMPAQRRFELPDKWQPTNWTADEFMRRLQLAVAELPAELADPMAEDLFLAVGLGYLTLDSQGRVVHASDDMRMVAEVATTLFALETCTDRNAG